MEVILDKPIAYDTKFGFEVVEGTATIDKDFTVSSTTIPAYTTTGSISSYYKQITLQKTETVKLKAGKWSRNDDLVQYLDLIQTFCLPEVEFTIENYIR